MSATNHPPVLPMPAVLEDGPVLRVDLNPTGGESILGVAALDSLIALFDTLHDRPGIRAVVLSSSGEDFCLGGDRREYRAALDTDATGTSLRRILDRGHRLCQALESSHTVTIARLHGKVVGQGLAVASFCDLRVAADTTSFRLPELGLGMPPAWGGVLGRLISEAGAARIRELMLTSETFDAPAAQRLGLLHKIAPQDGLDRAVSDWTRPISRRSAEALTLTKRMFAGYARADRTADVGLLDAHLMAAQLRR
ncbi:enoyl-CoA hydratase/isomerase family protein [Streptomyces qinzhouensis]|uniref:Enoyl-CoA hydratase/isomerase family protein n=1 Tax=Streptomyces qinzhouensis TaxID=2599401 RepID=A0A5B8JDT4_9ACTN|nr:enoyl-CoA hydratase/isomerase family protein [Streptomyces qinzhouensis]QDY79687.1 enoyl-CoA hydratase/isomerase family protein [Streptomyces qinzhouensis]